MFRTPKVLLVNKDAAFWRLHENYAALANERRKDKKAV